MVCQSECKRSVMTPLAQLKYGFIESVNAAGVASLSSVVTSMTRTCKVPSCTVSSSRGVVAVGVGSNTVLLCTSRDGPGDGR